VAHRHRTPDAKAENSGALFAQNLFLADASSGQANVRLFCTDEIVAWGWGTQVRWSNARARSYRSIRRKVAGGP
jgi:hypothetical protein